jgi:hypothetical protein
MPKRLYPAIAGLSLVVFGGLADAAAQTPYTIEGLFPGGQARLDSDYQCRPSQQLAGFTWCQRRRQERTSRGSFSSTRSVLQNPDGVVAYVNRDIEPAFFGANDIQSELGRLASRFGGRARVMRLPRREGLPSTVIATWGQLELEFLDGDAGGVVATEGSTGESLLVDYLGDLRRSVELGLPIFRLSGSTGYLWSASSDEAGRGHLRFLAVDASLLVSRPTRKAQSAPVATLAVETTASIPAKTTVERLAVAPESPKAAPADPVAERAEVEEAEKPRIAPDPFEAERPAVDLKHRSRPVTDGTLIAFAILALGAWLLAKRLQKKEALHLEPQHSARAAEENELALRDTR